MFDRILVPLDGSALSEAVLPQIRRFLRLEDCEVVLARAAEIVAVEPFPGLFEAALQEARTYLAGIERRLSDQGVRVRSVADLGRPADFILRCAEKEGASLIALATHGRRGVSRALSGSVAEEVLRRSPAPVFAVRPGPEDLAPKTEARPIRTILVPLDGGDGSSHAMSPAIGLARHFNARLVVLHVLVPEHGARAPSAKFRLDEACDQAHRQGVRTLCLIERGDPAKAILETGRFHGADLIAMATHGRTGIRRLLSGSVTESVLRQASVPVLVMRSGSGAEQRGVA